MHDGTHNFTCTAMRVIDEDMINLPVRSSIVHEIHQFARCAEVSDIELSPRETPESGAAASKPGEKITERKQMMSLRVERAWLPMAAVRVGVRSRQIEWSRGPDTTRKGCETDDYFVPYSYKSPQFADTTGIWGGIVQLITYCTAAKFPPLISTVSPFRLGLSPLITTITQAVPIIAMSSSTLI